MDKLGLLILCSSDLVCYWRQLLLFNWCDFHFLLTSLTFSFYENFPWSIDCLLFAHICICNGGIGGCHAIKSLLNLHRYCQEWHLSTFCSFMMCLQVELFCVNHLINCSLESTEEFICMEFRFTLRDNAMRAAFQLLHMVLEVI